MADGDLALLALRGRHHLGRLRAVEGKRLFHVHVAARSQGLQRQGRVRLRRRGDVDHVRPLALQQLREVVVVGRDGETGGQLLGHKALAIAHRHRLRLPRQLADLFDMAVGNLAAADDGHAQGPGCTRRARMRVLLHVGRTPWAAF